MMKWESSTHIPGLGSGGCAAVRLRLTVSKDVFFLEIYNLHSHLEGRPADAVRCAHGFFVLFMQNENPHFPVAVPVAAFGEMPTGLIPV